MVLKILFIKKYSYLITFFFFCVLSSSAISKEVSLKRELNVVLHDDHHPISFELPNGKPAGLYVDLWKLWSETTGTPVNFISDSMENGLLMVKSRKAVHSGLFRNKTRELWADFSVPIHRVASSILYNDTGGKKKTLEEFSGMKIAVLKGSYHEQYLIDNYPNIIRVPLRGASSILDLINKDIQAIFNESPSLNSLLAKMGLSSVLESNVIEDVSSLVHVLVAKGQTALLNEINRGFEEIPIQKVVLLEKKWLPNAQPFFSSKVILEALTLSERNWLQNNINFSLGIDHHSYPFEFTDDNNKLSGISSDYINYISKQLNINMIVAVDNTWAQSLEKLKEGKIDIMSSMVRSGTREKSMLFTKPYFQLPSVAVTKKGSFYADSMSSFDHKKVGVIKGYVFAELISNDYPDINIVNVSSAGEGLRLLNNGQIQGYIGALPIVNHEIHKESYYNLIVASFTPYKLQLSMAVRKGLEPLIPILNKALDSMDEKSKSIIANNWLAVRIQQGTKLTTILKWAIPILSGLILIIIIYIGINRRLKKEIKQRELLEEQLLQSEKMKALGEMAGGIAHDFNNLMGIILGNSELLSIKFPKNEIIKKFNNNIYNASTRATELVSQIMTFSRMSKAPLLSVNFSEVIHDCVQLIKSTAPKNIKISYDIEKGYDYIIKGDKTQINQVLLNLCTNAIDAMHVNPGVLALKLSGSNIQLPSGFSSIEKYYSLKVIDSGSGIDSSIINNVFDPFFSTKDVGKGTGLGLSVVYNILKGHNGNISVVNNDNTGVEFTLLLPRTLEAPLNEKPKVTNERLGKGNILIVEDEEDLRFLYREHLESSGYIVTACENGIEALELFKAYPESYDLLLTDHSMPLMTGTELIKAVLKIKIDMPVILATGYAEIESIEKVVSKDLYKCLVKPIKRIVLLETVYRCMENNNE
jgi:signal transduction histidine kinase/ActR/RegA family two-component response regulator